MANIISNGVKRVLIFSTAYFPFVGGAEVAVKEITDRISDIEFDMVTARMNVKLPKFERLGNINVYRIGIGWPIFDKLILAFGGAKFAKKLHKKNKYGAIWAIMASFGGLAAGIFKKKNPEVKFLLTLQEGDNLAEVERKMALSKRKFKSIFTGADYVQAISNYLAAWAQKMGAVCPIEVVPNGVNFNQLSINNYKFSINDFKKKLGFGENEKAVITVSRLVKKNGVSDLIEAMKNINAKLIVCGVGEKENKLRKLAKSLDIEDKILFLGHIPYDELPKYYAAADVFCRPSLTEGLGNVFLEAMAAGVPVIATPVGGIPDFLKDPSASSERATGWFCGVKNPESIAEKIKLILDEKNTALRQWVINNAREMVKEKYEWDKIAKRMDNIFNKLIF
ncbi:MAG: glycosyltransferase family 4 protein [Patescibacteria group bacterium]|nr:glycosyltransferase family 4 protein [Patescibacteria group bacterium]MDD5294458.1 glycosyltransferase family 4 protein [Patescibacteria group bacterium]MDD5554369.1 glycosyltransferase family 4 protein [Patescibacteria group bacterium]